MTTPREANDVDLAFGPPKLADFMPDMADVPDEFKRHRGTEWNRIASEWFFSGLKGTLIPKAGIDPKAAMRHLAVIMRSWEPKHEHKEAAVAYLMSQWFDRFERAA